MIIKKKGPANPTPSSNFNTNIWNPPATTAYTTPRTTTTTTTRRSWTTKAPFYNPSNPSYNGGGGYYGNRYGDDSTFGGSSFTRPTTKRPSSPSSSSGSGSGFFSGLQGILAGEVGKFISSAISNRGGGGSSGGFGSFFDTRPSTENKNYRGGLFNENTGTTSTGNHNYNAYPVTRYGDTSPKPAQPTASHGNFGWKLS